MPDTFARMRQLIGSTEEWTANDLVIGLGEIAIERTTTAYKMKVGNGTSVFSALPYASGGDVFVPWNNVTNKPTTFPPSAHTHNAIDLTGVLNWRDTYDPSGAAEYPPGVPKSGDLWGVVGAAYTFGAGTLAGKTVGEGAAIVYDNNRWNIIGGDYVKGSELTTTSTGLPQAGRVPQLNASGRLDPSLLNMPGSLRFRGLADPTGPAPTGATAGDYWLANVAGVAAASWTGIAGTTIEINDHLIWTGTAWTYLHPEDPVTGYLPIDGSQPMLGALSLAPYAGGEPTAAHAVRKDYLDAQAFRGSIYAGHYGVTTGTVADQTAALQAAIDAAEAQKAKLILPAGYIRLDGTIYVGRVNPVWIEGQQSHRFISFTDNDMDDVTCLWFENMPAATVGVLVAAGDPANTRDGVTISNVMIARTTFSVAGDGRVGIRFVGATSPCLENVSINGFDINFHLTEQTTGLRHTTYGQFRNVISMLSGTYCGLITAATDCDFYHCHFGGATAASFRIEAPVINAVPGNGNRWFGCVFTASQGSTPLHAVVVESGFWQSFHACDFEGSSDASFKINCPVNAATPSVFNVSMTDCWFSAAEPNNGGNLWVLSGNLMLQGGRFAGLPTSTQALIRIKPAVGSNAFTTTISNIVAVYRNIAAIDVANYGYLKITNCQFVGESSAAAAPAIIFGTGVNRSHVANNSFVTTHATGYTNGSATGGNRFLDNILSNNATADDYATRVVGGPPQTVGGVIPRHQLLGASGALAATLAAKYSADALGGFDYYFKTRAAAPGSRATVAAADSVRLVRYYADDGTTDQEVARQTVSVDAIGAFMGGSWEVGVKSSGSGNLSTRLKIDNAGTTSLMGGATVCPAGTLQYIGLTAGADTITATPTFGVFTAYITGAFYVARAGVTNTGAATLNINGLGAKALVKRVNTPLVAGDVLASKMLLIIYDGTNMQLINPVVP